MCFNFQYNYIKWNRCQNLLVSKNWKTTIGTVREQNPIYFLLCSNAGTIKESNTHFIAKKQKGKRDQDTWLIGTIKENVNTTAYIYIAQRDLCFLIIYKCRIVLHNMPFISMKIKYERWPGTVDRYCMVIYFDC